MSARAADFPMTLLSENEADPIHSAIIRKEAWTLDSVRRLRAGVIDGRSFIRAIQGMEFLAQTGAWDPKDRAAVRKWFDEYLHWLTESKNGLEEKNASNNHASWWTAQVAAVASFVENSVVE